MDGKEVGTYLVGKEDERHQRHRFSARRPSRKLPDVPNLNSLF